MRASSACQAGLLRLGHAECVERTRHKPETNAGGLTMNTRIARLMKLGLVPVLGAVALAASSGLTHAQTPPPGQQPIAPAIVGGGQGAHVQIWTDRSYYEVNDPIEYCVSVPFPGYVRIYDRLPNGQQHLLNSFYEWNSYDCFW